MFVLVSPSSPFLRQWPVVQGFAGFNGHYSFYGHGFSSERLLLEFQMLIDVPVFRLFTA
jgi:hypothetical protein